MDTSKEYIKMCDCKEIQLFPLASKWERWSMWFFWDALFAGNALPDYCSPIWLPHQDQLQEMLDDSPNPARMHNLLIWAGIEFDIKDMRTWEQLWLAFVMWELHAKQWLTSEQKWVTVNHEEKNR